MGYSHNYLVFGVSLDVTIAREKQPIPMVITKLVEHISKTPTCIRHPGIFRVAGAKKEIEALRVSFDAGKPLFLPNMRYFFHSLFTMIQVAMKLPILNYRIRIYSHC